MSESDTNIKLRPDLFQRREQWRKEATSYFRRILARLKTMGIAEVRIEFNGYGDSGAVESIRAIDEKGNEIELPAKLRDKLCIKAEDLLPAGFENNEGSFGELVLDVDERTLTREHHWRIESTEYEEEEWTL